MLAAYYDLQVATPVRLSHDRTVTVTRGVLGDLKVAATSATLAVAYVLGGSAPSWRAKV
jgi:hypothetical protein